MEYPLEPSDSRLLYLVPFPQVVLLSLQALELPFAEKESVSSSRRGLSGLTYALVGRNAVGHSVLGCLNSAQRVCSVAVVVRSGMLLLNEIIALLTTPTKPLLVGR